jgi:hypothetical protein
MIPGINETLEVQVLGESMGESDLIKVIEALE